MPNAVTSTQRREPADAGRASGGGQLPGAAAGVGCGEAEAGNGVGGGVPTAAAVWTRFGSGLAMVTASGLVS